MERISISLLLMLFSMYCTAKIIQEPQQFSSTTSPIIGTWIYTNNGCEEIYTFDALGNRFVTSHQERVMAKYTLDPVDPVKGIFVLKDHVIKDNAEPDCSGSRRNMEGDIAEVIVFIENNPSRFSFCFDPELKQCVGPFYKR